MRMTTRTRPAAKPRSRVIEIIATPGSGSGRALELARALHEQLRAGGHHATLAAFPDLERLRRWAATDSTRSSLLVCVGGDGTQSAAARAAVRRSVPFLSVPSGFGNLFAKALGAPTRADRVIEQIEHGQIIRMDVGLRNGELFLCQESFGLLSQIQERTEAHPVPPRARWRRWLAYYRTALRHLRDTPLTPFRVVVDGRIVAQEAVIVTVSNVKTYGPWLRLTPGASPVDGQFDVFVMEGATKGQILARLSTWPLRRPGTTPGAQLYRGRRIRVGASARGWDELVLIPHRLPVMVSSEAAEALRHEVNRVDRVA